MNKKAVHHFFARISTLKNHQIWRRRRRKQAKPCWDWPVFLRSTIPTLKSCRVSGINYTRCYLYYLHTYLYYSSAVLSINLIEVTAALAMFKEWFIVKKSNAHVVIRLPSSRSHSLFHLALIPNVRLSVCQKRGDYVYESRSQTFGTHPSS